MAVTAFDADSPTAVIGTEHFFDVDEAGTFIFVVDTSNMVDGDVLELRVYQKVLTGGSAVVLAPVAYYGEQPAHDKIKSSIPVSNELVESQALRFSLKQTFGTGRVYPYKILKHA